MSTLIVALGAYAAIRQNAFLTSYNIGNLLLATMPLALVAMGQTVALLVRGFDVSVAALMTMCVVTASFDSRDRRRDRCLQRDADPLLPPALDHRNARHAQHPRRRVALAAERSCWIN